MTGNDFFDCMLLDNRDFEDPVHLKLEVSEGIEPYFSISIPSFTEEEIDSMVLELGASAGNEIKATKMLNWFASYLNPRIAKLKLANKRDVHRFFGFMMAGKYGDEMSFTIDAGGYCRIILGDRPEELGEYS